ncbi:MAG TPA: thiamine pyrophosphate-dependent enzyme, partial [Rhodocyclaceae bacterium]|nr:thiamine pyrophosphate-dependent enzyme [Rhodocyclaceae bacterium]
YELRAAETIDAVLLRGVQLATTMPEGPVYLTGAREIWEKRVPASREIPAHWPAATLGALSPAAAAELHQALRQAQRPLVLTTYLGRQIQAVDRLVALSERLGFGVCELGPQYLSFPGEHPHHLGYRRNELIAEADLILMIDVDVPWIASKVLPAEGARLFHIDLDPIKQGLGFWHYPAQRSYQADSLKALEQLLAIGDEIPAEARRQRGEWLAAVKQRQGHAAARAAGAEITAEELTLAVRDLVNERTVIVFEAPSNTELIPSLLKLNRPGSYFASGGSGLGWGINAAIGAKLADPEAEVIALIGDGCFMFGVPSSAYWVSGAYQAPHLTVIYNNGGWNSPKLSTLGVHPKGDAKRNDTYWVTVGHGARLAEIAAATGGAVAYRVSERQTLKQTLAEALQTVRAGKSAVVDVSITPISTQVLA